MTAEPPAGIARHTVRGSFYSVAASAITIGLGFARATLMARLLADNPEYFGVTTLALFFLGLASQMGTIGVNSAFIQQKETEERSRATYFTLSLVLTVGSMLLLAVFLPLISSYYKEMPQLGTVLLAYIGVELLRSFNSTQTTMMSKDLAFGRLSLVDVISSITMTLVGPGLAWLGAGVWSIVGERASGALARGVMIGLVYRPWRPQLAWDRQRVRRFWDFGVKVWWSTNLTFLLDRFDDFWIGTLPSLGAISLGYYSRAYEFARYPRRVIANPLLSVFFPTFAHIQDDRLKLSRAFFRATSLMVRTGALFSLIFILTAPEFIRIFLGEKWLPMLLTFQLMIVYTLLDPLSLAAQNLLMATGHPDRVLRVRIAQALVFVPAVIGLAGLWGIEGVALAANLMILIGAVLLFRQIHGVVDYSDRTLWLWPLIGVLITGGVVMALSPLWAGMRLWAAFVVKLFVIPTLFGLLLWITEKDQLIVGWRMVWSLLKPVDR